MPRRNAMPAARRGLRALPPWCSLPRPAEDCAPYQYRQPFQGCVMVRAFTQGVALGCTRLLFQSKEMKERRKEGVGRRGAGSGGKGIGAIASLAVFKEVEIGRFQRAGHVLAGHADEGAGEAREAGRGGFIGEDAGVE